MEREPAGRARKVHGFSPSRPAFAIQVQDAEKGTPGTELNGSGTGGA